MKECFEPNMELTHLGLETSKQSSKKKYKKITKNNIKKVKKLRIFFSDEKIFEKTTVFSLVFYL